MLAKTHARQGNFDIAATILEHHTMVPVSSSGEYQPLVPSSDGQSSQSSLDGHCNTSGDKHSGISYLTTFLIAAARAGHDTVVATLIGAGADVNKATLSTGTPLRAVARAGHDNIVATLIGADAIG